MLRFILAAVLFAVAAVGGRAEEVLYNGIRLPEQWPPKPEAFARDRPIAPPYLADPPKVIPIDVGRQLFVDDFLIEETDFAADVSSADVSCGLPDLQGGTALGDPARYWFRGTVQ